MKITAVKQAEVTAGLLRLTVTDTNGTARDLDLSSRAEEQILTVLLSAPPVKAGLAPMRGPIVAENVRLYVGLDGTIVLEAFLTPKSAVHIALPGSLPERLKDLLSQDPAQWQGPAVN